MSFLGDFLRNYEQQERGDNSKTASSVGYPYVHHVHYNRMPIYIYSSKEIPKKQQDEIFSAVKNGIQRNYVPLLIRADIENKTGIPISNIALTKTREFVSVIISN